MRLFELWFLVGMRRVAVGRNKPKIRLVPDDEICCYNALMAEHHNLGVAASGRVLRYVAKTASAVPLVLGTFGSAAWRVEARDGLIGWEPVQRSERLEQVVSNQRLCVPPGSDTVPHAASRARAAMLRRLPADHERACGVRPTAAKSFTDPQTHSGTVYKAWPVIPAGQTGGFGRTRAARISPVTGSGSSTGSRSWPQRDHGIDAGVRHGAADRPGRPGLQHPERVRRRRPAGLPGLGDRPPQGQGHPAQPGRDPGGDSRGPPVGRGLRLRVRAVRRVDAARSAASLLDPAHTRLGKYVPPSPKTIKRAVRAVDVAAADEQMCAWLRAEAAARRPRWRRHIAVDDRTFAARKATAGRRRTCCPPTTSRPAPSWARVAWTAGATKSAVSSPSCKPSSPALAPAAEMASPPQTRYR